MDTVMPPQSEVTTDETRNLISADKVVGTAVYNRREEHLGSVYGLMLNKLNGQVAYAIMSFGGFLGMGESYHPLPWRVLTYDTRLGGYVVDLDRSQLEKGAELYGRTRLGNLPQTGRRLLLDAARVGAVVSEPASCESRGAKRRRSRPCVVRDAALKRCSSP